MSELHLRQLTITKEIHTRAEVSQVQLEESIKQNKTSAACLQEIEQQKKEAEQTTTTLLQALDEACRSLSDSDIQETEEPKQKIAKMKDYTQQSHSELERMKIEYQQQIAELQLRIPPETPPEVRQQRQQDIKASAAKISDNMASVAQLMEDSIEAWANLQDPPDVGKIQETIKLRQDELDAVRIEIKTLPPMQNMAKVKRSKELQQEIESCRTKVTMLESALQPLVDEALELTNATESQLKILKAYDNFA